MVAAIVAGTASDSEAALRYRANGYICVFDPNSSSFDIHLSSYNGARFFGTDFSVVCPIPTGPSLVSLSGANALSTVNVRLMQDTNGQTVFQSSIRVHDFDGWGSCGCGHDTNVTSGSTTFHNVSFDCGACSYSSNWGINLQIHGTGVSGSYGWRLVNLISVYDGT